MKVISKYVPTFRIYYSSCLPVLHLQVDIGQGVLVERSTVDLLMRSYGSAALFARGFSGACSLMMSSRRCHKGVDTKEALDPARLSSVIGA